jgi:hypothetical protein
MVSIKEARAQLDHWGWPNSFKRKIDVSRLIGR